MEAAGYCARCVLIESACRGERATEGIDQLLGALMAAAGAASQSGDRERLGSGRARRQCTPQGNERLLPGSIERSSPVKLVQRKTASGTAALLENAAIHPLPTGVRCCGTQPLPVVDKPAMAAALSAALSGLVQARRQRLDPRLNPGCSPVRLGPWRLASAQGDRIGEVTAQTR